MGWPRLRNTLGGWHVGAAWGLLPLVILSPLTGLALVYGVTFTPPATGPRGERVPIAKAVEMIADRHDLGTSLRSGCGGGRLVARIFEDGALSAYVVRPSGLEAQSAAQLAAGPARGQLERLARPSTQLLVSVAFSGCSAQASSFGRARTLQDAPPQGRAAGRLEPGRVKPPSAMLEAFFILCLCQLVGETLARLLSLPVPGPVIGMALLFAALQLRSAWRPDAPATQDRPIGSVSAFLLANLSLLFVPAGVGIVAQLPVLASHGVGLSIALAVSTLISLSVTALVFAALSRRFSGSDAAGGEP